MKLINNTKDTSKIGYTVVQDPRNPNAFIYATASDTQILGIVAQSVPYRKECEIITFGVAMVYVVGNVTRGAIIRSRKGSDGISNGTCKVAKSADTPYVQVGIALESGNGLIKVELSFKYVLGSTFPAETDPVATVALAAMKEPTGFENRTDSSWTFTDGTRKLEVTTVSGYNIWFHGVVHNITTTKDIIIADTEGIHLIYFDTDDVIKEYVNPTIGEVLVAIRDKALIALIYWDATSNVGVYVGEERHGTVMDGITHYYLHYTRGLQIVSGLGLGDFIIGDGSLDTHAQFSVATGSVADEDIGLTVSAIASNVGLPILYKDGANGYWRTVTQAGYSCYQNPAGATNRLMYNQWTGVVWQLTEVGEGNYVLYHVFASTGKVKQMYSIMGEVEYTTLPAARAGAQSEISTLVLGSLPSVEMRPVGTVIFQTDKDYGNAINARVIEETLGGADYIDWRTSELPRGVAPADHGNLTGLSDDDHASLYPLITFSRSGAITNTTTTPYAVLTTDAYIYVDATAGAKIVNLPLATGSGRIITVKKVGGAIGNTVTVTADTTGVADLIDGNPTVVLATLYTSVTIQDATPNLWYRIASQ